MAFVYNQYAELCRPNAKDEHRNSAAIRPINVWTKLNQQKLLLGAGFQAKTEGHDTSARKRWDGRLGGSRRQ
jgi:hypothetical protein